jgi:HAD superfamily hydrolase (TIGR01509 family)
VLIGKETEADLSAWKARYGMNRPDLESTVYGGEMGAKAFIGELTDEALWLWAGERLSLSVDRTMALRDAFHRSYSLDPEIVRYLQGIRSRYKIALLSNAPSNLRTFLRDVYKIEYLFDLVVSSAEERVAKPDPEIYRRTLARFDCSPSQAVLIDDRPANIASAQGIGMSGIVFGASTNLPAELERLGVK